MRLPVPSDWSGEVLTTSSGNQLKLEIAPVRLNFDGLFAKILKICTFYSGSFNLTNFKNLNLGLKKLIFAKKVAS